MIDLDGVLNIYNGKFAPDYIPPIKNGAKQFLQELVKEYDVDRIVLGYPKNMNNSIGIRAQKSESAVFHVFLWIC